MSDEMKMNRYKSMVILALIDVDLSETHQWIAIDADHRVCAYAQKPHISECGTQWKNGEPCICPRYIMSSPEDNFGLDWKESILSIDSVFGLQKGQNNEQK